MKTNKEWALYYLRLGFSVIPVGRDYKKPNKKEPFINTWLEFQNRLPIEDEVNKWWNKTPDAKPGIICGKVSNLIVVDIDDVEAFKKSGIRLPKTPTVKTGNGFHYYFKYEGADFPVTVNLPFGEIRVKAYVIAPPALHHDEEGVKDGEYIWSVPLEIEEMPVFDYNIFSSLSKEIKDRKNPIELLKGVKMGENRNIKGASMAGFILKLFPREQWDTEGWNTMLDWNLGVEQGKKWSEEELYTIFQSVIKTRFREEEKVINEYIPTTFSSLMLKTSDPQPFLVQDLIKKQSLNIIHGATGCGKSLLILKMIDDITIGKPFLDKFNVVKSNCLLIDMEMTEDDCIVRAKDVCSPNNNSIISCEKSWNISDKNSVEWLKKNITDKNINLVIFDTFSKIHSADENSNSGITPVMIELMNICNEMKVTIILLHHVNKSKDVTGLSRGRGATAIADNAGSYLEVRSKKLLSPFGKQYLAMTVSNEKSRRRESIGAFDLCIKYNEEIKRTEFEYLGESAEILDPINKARDEVFKIINNEPGLNKTAIKDKLKNIVSRESVDDAVKSLEGEVKLRIVIGKGGHCIYPINEDEANTKQEEIDINEINF